MTNSTTGTVVKNDNGAHCYFGPEFLTDSLNPLQPGGQFAAVAVGDAVVIAPKGELRSCSIDIPDRLGGIDS